VRLLLAIDRWAAKIEAFFLCASLVVLLVLTLYSVAYRNFVAPVVLKMQSQAMKEAATTPAAPPARIESAGPAAPEIKAEGGAEAPAAKPSANSYAGDLEDDEPAKPAPAPAAKPSANSYAGDLEDDEPAPAAAGEGAAATTAPAPAPVAPVAPVAEMKLPEDTPLLAFLKWLTFGWIDVVTRHLLLYIAFFGAALAVRQRGHIKIELLSRLFKGHYGDKLRILLNLVSMVVCAFLVRAAWRFLLSESEGGGMLYGSIPSWVGIVIVPVGFGLLSFHFGLEALVGLLDALGTGSDLAEARRAELGLNEEVAR
jgi:TRAP-type C4-dicarboxylate transport system permease small subunit